MNRILGTENNIMEESVKGIEEKIRRHRMTGHELYTLITKAM